MDTAVGHLQENQNSRSCTVLNTASWRQKPLSGSHRERPSDWTLHYTSVGPMIGLEQLRLWNQSTVRLLCQLRIAQLLSPRQDLFVDLLCPQNALIIALGNCVGASPA